MSIVMTRHISLFINDKFDGGGNIFFDEWLAQYRNSSVVVVNYENT